MYKMSVCCNKASPGLNVPFFFFFFPIPSSSTKGLVRILRLRR